jgi:DNA-binding LacI/PurR family transcriptional regulator
MQFEEALKKIEGAQSVSGQLIVVRDGVHILVGKNVQGVLIVEETAEAIAVAAEVGIKVVAADDDDGQPKTHHVHLDDKVETKDSMGGKK